MDNTKIKAFENFGIFCLGAWVVEYIRIGRHDGFLNYLLSMSMLWLLTGIIILVFMKFFYKKSPQ